MLRKLAILSAIALSAAPAFAETGVGTLQIDNVTNVYGRAGVPAVKVTGSVVTRSTDVNVAGRESLSGGADKTVVSSGENVDQGFGRS
jgi:ABC-type glucose/galactose transport system permease subunit